MLPGLDALLKALVLDNILLGTGCDRWHATERGPLCQATNVSVTVSWSFRTAFQMLSRPSVVPPIESKAPLPLIDYMTAKICASPYRRQSDRNTDPTCCPPPLERLRKRQNWFKKAPDPPPPCDITIRDNVFFRCFVWLFYIVALYTMRNTDDYDMDRRDRKRVTIPGLPFFLKAGQRVRLEEAHLTVYLRKLLRGKGVEVPRVYCAFRRPHRRGEETCILMSRFRGDKLNVQWNKLSSDKQQGVLETIKSAVEHMRTDQKTRVCGLLRGPLLHPCLPSKTIKGKRCNSIGPYRDIRSFHQYLIEAGLEKEAKDVQDVHRFQHRFVCPRFPRWHAPRTFFSHGDLSPYNIMVDLQGHACIVDWETAGWWPGYVEHFMSKRYEESKGKSTTTPWGVNIVPWTLMKVPLDDIIPVHPVEKVMIKHFQRYYFTNMTY